MNRTILSTACAALLVACAAMGVKVSDEALASLKPGTTIANAMDTLGQPTSRMRMADGTTLLQYVYAEATVRAASFVPIVGAFAGGTDVRSSMATLRFDAQGKLLDVTSSESQYGTGVGVSAGKINQTTVPQPRQ